MSDRKTSGSVSYFITLLSSRRNRIRLRCRELFWYLLCKASQACFPSPGLPGFGSNCSNTLCAAPIVVNLNTLNECSFAESQALIPSTLEGSHVRQYIPFHHHYPQWDLPPPLLLRIGSGFLSPDTILPRKSQDICRISLNGLDHSTKSVTSNFGIELII